MSEILQIAKRKPWNPSLMTDDELRAEVSACEARVEDAKGWSSALEAAKMLKIVVNEGNRRGLNFVNKYPIKRG